MESAYVKYEIRINGKRSHDVSWENGSEDHIRSNVALQFDVPESEIEVRRID